MRAGDERIERTRRGARAIRSCERGAAAVEFALVVTPFLALMFGVVEYARYTWTIEAIQETATAGARCIGMNLNGCSPNGTYSRSNAVSFIQNEAQKWLLTVPAANITISTSGSCKGVSGFSQVQVAYTFQSVVPELIAPFATGKVIKGAACFPGAN